MAFNALFEAGADASRTRIFWSWQSDHPGNIGRHRLWEALKLAVDTLNEDLAIEEPEGTI